MTQAGLIYPNSEDPGEVCILLVVAKGRGPAVGRERQQPGCVVRTCSLECHPLQPRTCRAAEGHMYTAGPAIHCYDFHPDGACSHQKTLTASPLPIKPGSSLMPFNNHQTTGRPSRTERGDTHTLGTHSARPHSASGRCQYLEFREVQKQAQAASWERRRPWGSQRGARGQAPILCLGPGCPCFANP